MCSSMSQVVTATDAPEGEGIWLEFVVTVVGEISVVAFFDSSEVTCIVFAFFFFFSKPDEEHTSLNSI
jgi:hypothetical protein